MIGYSRFIGVGFILVCLSHQVHARSQTSMPQSMAYSVAHALELYALEHDGRLPTQWDELSPRYLLTEGVQRAYKLSLDELMILLPAGVIELPQQIVYNQAPGYAVAITRPQIVETRRKHFGRYVIWRSPNGRFHCDWADESLIGPTFRAAGHPLPQDSYFPPHSLFDYYFKRNINWIVMGGVALIALAVWWRYANRVA